MTTEPCIFCRIVQGKEKSYTISENETAIAILDINPFSAGHTLIIPKRHVTWWYDMNEEEVHGVFMLARDISQRIMKVLHPEFVAIYARGKRVPHTHIFLIPSYGDSPFDKFFDALQKFQESPEDLANLRRPEVMNDVARRLRAETQGGGYAR